MSEVVLHIYDVTNSTSVKTNSAIVQLNKIFKDGIGMGGIFHSAVEGAYFKNLCFDYVQKKPVESAPGRDY